MPTEPIYFQNPEALRRWFAESSSSATELIVGYMKVATGLPSVTWPQSVDEALCVGWIDGIRHRIDDARYQIRFTPRRPGSNWSAVNIERVAVLQAEGRMTPAGLAAFERRSEDRSGKAAYEQPEMPELSAAQARLFRAQPQAWAYFESLPPGYRKKVTWWVTSAKRLPTQEKRLAKLMAACARGERQF